MGITQDGTVSYDIMSQLALLLPTALPHIYSGPDMHTDRIIFLKTHQNILPEVVSGALLRNF